MPASQILQQLYSLKTSSPDFLRVLYALIKNDEDERYSSTLEGAELARLVDFLDNALCSIPTTDDVFRQCLRKLRAICGTHTTLPSSHIIRGDLTTTGISAIAYGGFADVWQGKHVGRGVCIKVLRISLHDTTGLRKAFFKEAVVWKRLRHPNIVPFLGVTTNPLQFVAEWMPNGTLTDYVTKHPGANRIALLLDVAEGLNFLHASYTIHGDLKGPNILINDNGHACLADFGLTSIVHGKNSIGTRIHGYTVRWTAPEVIEGAHEITREADVFSFGMVVVEAFTGKHPFSEFRTHTAMLKITAGERPAHPPGTEILGFVAPVWNMTADCWRHNSAYRPIMAAVVEFLRECYTLHTTDPSLSTLSPWTPTGNAVDTSIYGVISPAATGSDISPIRMTRTSQGSGHSFALVQDPSRSPTFSALFPKDSHGSLASLDESLSDESRAYSTPGESAAGRSNKSRNASPNRDNRKGGKRPQRSGKALWQGLAAIIRFRVFASTTSVGAG